MVEKHGTLKMCQPLGIFAAELHKRGISYLKAFEILSDTQDEMLLYPSYFLLSHAVELLLKSFLAAHGTPKKELKKLGHKLPNLLKDCFERALPAIDNLQPIIKHLEEMGQDYDFRYPTGYRLSMPRPKECLAIFRPLALAIEPEVQKAKTRDMMRFASETAHLRRMKIQWSD